MSIKQINDAINEYFENKFTDDIFWANSQERGEDYDRYTLSEMYTD